MSDHTRTDPGIPRWRIVPQRDGKKGEVPIKRLKYYPCVDKETGATRFARIKGCCFRVIFKHQLEADHEDWRAVFTSRGYNVTCPKKLVPKDPSNPLCTESVLVAGDRLGRGKATTGSMSLAQFERFLSELCGNDFKERVVGLFRDSLDGSKP